MEQSPDEVALGHVRQVFPDVGVGAWFALAFDEVDQTKPPPQGFVLPSPAFVAVGANEVHVVDVRWPGPNVRVQGTWPLSDIGVSQVRTRSARVRLPGAAAWFNLRPQHAGTSPAAVVAALTSGAGDVRYDATDRPFPVTVRQRLACYVTLVALQAARALFWGGTHDNEVDNPGVFAAQMAGLWLLVLLAGEGITRALTRLRAKEDPVVHPST